MPFDLEKAIAAWCRPYVVNPLFSAEDIEELEGSLRDRVEALREKDLSEKQAFRRAVKRVGSYGTAEQEYRKVYWGKVKREHRLTDELKWRLTMFKNYLKVALRSFQRQKGYSFINMAGLAVGLACFLLISLFVRFELSYDTFHEKADRIYRVGTEAPGSYRFGTNRYVDTSAPMVAALMDEVPEVEYATQIEINGVALRRGNDLFPEEGIYATRHFFDVFSFELLQGDPRTALVEPGSIILTASLAQKYFGEEDPMGKTLSDGWGLDESTFTVVGVVADPPPNSHFTFDFLLSMTTSSNYRHLLETDQWNVSNYLTYVSLRPGYDLPAFREKLVALGQKYLGRIGYYQDNPDEIPIYFPQALTDIHLHSDLNNEIDTEDNITYVYLFSAIGLLILLIACINYMNLATARSLQRAKEVSVRKAMGAQRVQLVGQFMGEAMILSTAALGLAVGLVYLLLPSFNALTAREMSLEWVEQSGFWLTVLALGLGVGFLAGSYPALVLSGFAPVSVMKGVLKRGAGKMTLRNGLVVAQFAITTALVVSTFVIHQQLHYFRTANTGLDRDHVVLIRAGDGAVMAQYEALKQTLSRHPNVLGVTASRQDPTEIGSWAESTSWEGIEEGQQISFFQSAVQPEFVELFGIELVEGRDFSERVTADTHEGLLINETMARQLGWETAAGKWLNFQGQRRHIVGVMKDFNFRSFHEATAPLVLHLGRDWPFARVLVKVRPERMQATLAHLEATMATFSPASPFIYEFLDDAYNNMYRAEVRLGRLFSYFTGLALLIACLGLFGLAAFMTAQRTKEIGVRKVLGASLADILVLLSKDFFKLVVLAFIIAAPLAYLAMQRWLEGFAYRIDLGPALFLFTGGLVFLVALLTVSYQSIKAALADPVKSLRYE